MKKPVIIAAGVGVLLLVGLASSFVFKRASQKVGEQMVEQMVESQTGAKVDIDSDSAGQVTIKTDDGSAQYSAGGKAEVPDSFPKELLIISDAKVVMSSAAENTSSVTFYTNMDSAVVFDKYLSDLTAAGWTKGMQVDAGTGKMISLTKGAGTVVITIGDNESDDQQGQTMVNLAYTVDSE